MLNHWSSPWAPKQIHYAAEFALGHPRPAQPESTASPRGGQPVLFTYVETESSAFASASRRGSGTRQVSAAAILSAKAFSVKGFCRIDDLTNCSRTSVSA